MFVPIPTNKYSKILYDTYFDPRNVINLIKMSENDVITTKIVPQNLAQFLSKHVLVCFFGCSSLVGPSNLGPLGVTFERVRRR